MFRTILTQARKPFNLSAFTSEFCTKAPVFRHRREINDVKIVGTLINDSFTLQSGTKALTVKTRDSPVKYSNHNIHINTEANYMAGQRVYIVGKLRSSSVQIAEGKSLTASVVKALQLYVLENETGSSNSTDGDKNSVEILANVATDILVKDRDSSFAVATHFTRKNEQGEDTTGTYYHRVFAYNDDVREFIHANLKKSDRVLVNGRIGHMTNTSPDGKKIYSGFIVAESIFKVARRSNADVESNESAAEVKAEN